MVDTEGDFDNFQDCFTAFFEKWGEFVTDINIEAYGEDVDDCIRYWLRDGKIVSTEGRMVFDQNETVW